MWRLATIATIAAAFAAGSAAACSCEFIPTLPEAYAASAAVFTGTVGSIERFEVWTGYFRKRVTFAQEACWKGPSGPAVSVVTEDNPAMCGIEFELGTSYLVFATSPQHIGSLYAIMCTRTRPTAYAQDDIVALGEPTCTIAVDPATWGNFKRLYD